VSRNFPDNALYEGRVFHKRFRPKTHSLGYTVFSVFLDLDRLARLDRELRLFSYNRWNIFSIFDSDFGAGAPLESKQDILGLLENDEVDTDGLKVYLLCYPRILGYVFNPLNTYFCYRQDGTLAAIVYEVNNTFGHRQNYLFVMDPPVVSEVDPEVSTAIDPICRGFVPTHSCDKQMHVSPFTPMGMRYDFRTEVPGQSLSVAIRLYDENGTMMTANFSGSRNPMSDARLLRNALLYPLMTIKVISGIHWEALRLWLKRIPWYHHSKSNQ